MVEIVPSKSLRIARREFEKIDEIKVLEDLSYDENNKLFVLKFSITLTSSEVINSFPLESDWFLVIEDIENFSEIRFYPSKQKGIKTTYQHQYFNVNSDNDPWRTGYPCVEDYTDSISATTYSDAPISLTQRLKWYIRKLLKWVRAAASNNLVKNGDVFEAPIFYFNYTDGRTLIYSESRDDLNHFWKDLDISFGSMEWFSSGTKLFLHNLKNKHSEVIKSVVSERVGNKISPTLDIKASGIWIRLNQIPVVQNWQVPLSMEELNLILEREGLNLFSIIEKKYEVLGRKVETPVVIYFPVPEFVGGENTIMYPRCFLLPEKLRQVPGINKIKGKNAKAKVYVESIKDNKITWIKSENLNWQEISGRGQHNDLSDKKVLLIGAGSFGSLLAENLVRGGVDNLLLVDSDRMTAGNMTRHTLNLSSVGHYKTLCLKYTLESIRENLIINTMEKDIEDAELDFRDFNLVIDTTGSDKVLMFLLSHSLDNLFSLSIGYKARSLYLHKGASSFNEVSKIFRPTLEQEKKESLSEGFPTDGIGCWYPLFPATYTDVSLAVSLSVRWIKNIVNEGINNKTEVKSLEDLGV